MQSRRTRSRPSRRTAAGQALIEFLLALALSIGVVSIISISFRKSVLTLWYAFTKEIAAPCPGCPPPLEVKKLQ